MAYWEDFTAKIPNYVCKVCGFGFSGEEGWLVNENGKRVFVCDGDILPYCRKQERYARGFIDANLLQNEFLLWWWQGVPEIDKVHLLKKVYEEYEQDKAYVEMEFADSEHEAEWVDWVMSEKDGEKV